MIVEVQNEVDKINREPTIEEHKISTNVALYFILNLQFVDNFQDY
jgi:hypothetical protein